jgi:hypothetical protein
MSDQPVTDGIKRRRFGQLRDDRGRWASQFDPVRLYLLNQKSAIPAETLRSMADQILPGAKRQRLLQILSVSSGVLLIVGGNFIYYRFFSTWKGLDPVIGTIYVVQAMVILAGPLIAYRIAKNQYAKRVARVMLEHRYCPHCAYDIRALPIDPADGATVCPECGCAWKLDCEAN